MAVALGDVHPGRRCSPVFDDHRSRPRGRAGEAYDRGAWNRPAPIPPPPCGADPRSPAPSRGDSTSAELDELKLQAQALERELEQVRSHLATASTRRSSPVAVVDDALCTGCGICASICPNEAIVIKQAAVIDPERCSGCGACVQQCPRQAMFVRSREDR